MGNPLATNRHTLQSRGHSSRVDLDTITGIAMIVLGALVFLGEFTAFVGFLLEALGVVLIILGLLMLLDVVSGGVAIGIVTLVAGLLLYGDLIGVPNAITQVMNVVVGIVLIVLGVLQLR